MNEAELFEEVESLKHHENKVCSLILKRKLEEEYPNLTTTQRTFLKVIKTLVATLRYPTIESYDLLQVILKNV